MANIEELISEIPDPRLREAIAREVAALKKGKKFGLVFEEHIPETIRLLGYPIQPGTRVSERANGGGLYTVRSITDGLCRPAPENGDGDEITVPLAALVAVKRFGEPIYPSLTPVGRLECAPGKPWHTIINADNYHALQLLLYTCEGQVDVIYIDPPYNSGAHDWRYNNDYVDSNDQWRHSKWLSMMQRRLRLAKRLLNPGRGVLIVTVDENEVHHLGVLLETVFADAYRQMVTIVINPKGVARGRFSRVEEHAIYCFMPKAGVIAGEDDLLTPEADAEEDGVFPRWGGLLRSGRDARREDRWGMFYPVLVDPNRRAVLGAGEPLEEDEEPDFMTLINGLVPVWPVRSDGSLGRWAVGPVTLRVLIEKGYVALGGV